MVSEYVFGATYCPEETWPYTVVTTALPVPLAEASVAKLLVSASAVRGVVGSLGFDSADVLFETAVGVFVDDVLYKITNSFSSQAMGMPYCYWLMLEPPVR